MSSKKNRVIQSAPNEGTISRTAARKAAKIVLGEKDIDDVVKSVLDKAYSEEKPTKGTIRKTSFVIDGIAVKIEKDIPIQKKRGPGCYGPWIELIRSLEIKESFVYPYRDPKNRGKIYNSLVKIFRQLGYKFASAQVYDDNNRVAGLRFWRIG